MVGMAIMSERVDVASRLIKYSTAIHPSHEASPKGYIQQLTLAKIYLESCAIEREYKIKII